MAPKKCSKNPSLGVKLPKKKKSLRFAQKEALLKANVTTLQHEEAETMTKAFLTEFFKKQSVDGWKRADLKKFTEEKKAEAAMAKMTARMSNLGV